MNINGLEYLSTSQAGRIMNLTQQRVRQLAITEGKLSHKRVGENGWIYVSKKDVETLMGIVQEHEK